MYKIAMAMPSPIYAPLYLAKSLDLPVFSNVDFNYVAPPSHDLDGPDPLVNSVIGGSAECIAAVGDPMRFGFKSPNAPALPDDPDIVASLIDTMCYWLIGDKKDADAIIVHPERMTGYSVTLYSLTKNESDPIKIKSTLAKLNTYCRPGFEHHAYSALKFKHNLQRAVSGASTNSTAYITTDYKIFKREDKNNRVRERFATDPDFQDVIMTGLISSNKIREDKPALFDAICEDIQYAMLLIKDDPEFSAYALSNYTDGYMNFKGEWSYDQLFTLLDDTSKHINGTESIYDIELTPSDQKLAKSREIREDIERKIGSRIGRELKSHHELQLDSLTDIVDTRKEHRKNVIQGAAETIKSSERANRIQLVIAVLFSLFGLSLAIDWPITFSSVVDAIADPIYHFVRGNIHDSTHTMAISRASIWGFFALAMLFVMPYIIIIRTSPATRNIGAFVSTIALGVATLFVIASIVAMPALLELVFGRQFMIDKMSEIGDLDPFQIIQSTIALIIAVFGYLKILWSPWLRYNRELENFSHFKNRINDMKLALAQWRVSLMNSAKS